MSERLGPLTFGKKKEEIFLGREITQHRDFSDDTAKVIDEEVRQIIEAAEERASKILKENLQSLKLLAESLLEHEVIDGEDIKRLLEGKKLRNKNNKKSATKTKTVKPAKKATSSNIKSVKVKNKESTAASPTEGK